jgi:SAM-dependent methyltransferase
MRMSDVWEHVFAHNQLIWGLEPTAAALLARQDFVHRAVKSVLVPGVGYGRNAKVFVDAGMSVTGIEVSATAIELARSKLGLDIPIHHGSVTDMPFDDQRYDAVFCYGLLYLLDASERAKFLADCARQVVPRGPVIFTVVSKKAPMFGRGTKLGEDWYETHPGVKMFFYDENSLKAELGRWGRVDIVEIDEPMHDGSSLPFLQATFLNETKHHEESRSST